MKPTPVSNDFMLYPGYAPPREPFPLVIHYGITFDVNDYGVSLAWCLCLSVCLPVCLSVCLRVCLCLRVCVFACG